MDRLQAIQLVDMLTAAFPQRDISRETAEVYATMLQGLDFDATRIAVLELIATSTFFPAIAEIRKAVAQSHVDAKPWQDAWDEVMTAVRNYGSYLGKKWGNDWVGWSSPAVDKVVRAIGYSAICETELKQLPTVRAQFRDIYEAGVDRLVRTAQTGDLALERTAAASIGGGE